MPICSACLEEKDKTRVVKETEDTTTLVCNDCLGRVVDMFHAALKAETEYPPHWDSHTKIPLTLVEDFLTPEFKAAYAEKIVEYKTPKNHRMICANGHFVGSNADNTDKVCTCGEKVSANTPEVESPEDRFEGMTKGKEYQFCPDCDIPIELEDACNHMTCTACNCQFCYICGSKADARSGHWLPDGCPRWGHPDSDRVRHDRPVPAPNQVPVVTFDIDPTLAWPAQMRHRDDGGFFAWEDLAFLRASDQARNTVIARSQTFRQDAILHNHPFTQAQVAASQDFILLWGRLTSLMNDLGEPHPWSEIVLIGNELRNLCVSTLRNTAVQGFPGIQTLVGFTVPARRHLELLITRVSITVTMIDGRLARPDNEDFPVPPVQPALNVSFFRASDRALLFVARSTPLVISLTRTLYRSLRQAESAERENVLSEAYRLTRFWGVAANTASQLLTENRDIIRMAFAERLRIQKVEMTSILTGPVLAVLREEDHIASERLLRVMILLLEEREP